MNYFKLTKTGASYYYVYVNGNAITKHTEEKEAIEHGQMHKAKDPLAIVTLKHEYEVGIEIADIKPEPPSPPAPEWKYLDFGIMEPRHNSGDSVIVTPDNYKSFKYKIIRNAGRVRFTGWKNQRVDLHIKCENIYNVQIQDCSNINLLNIGIDGSAKGFDFRNSNHIGVYDWYSFNASDPGTNDNGDPFIIENDCYKIDMFRGKTIGIRDTGVGDCKGDDCSVNDHIGRGGWRSLKIWGERFKGKNIKMLGPEREYILQIRGSSEFDEDCSMGPAVGGVQHIRTGLSWYENRDASRDWKKSVVYEGSFEAPLKVKQGTFSDVIVNGNIIFPHTIV